MKKAAQKKAGKARKFRIRLTALSVSAFTVVISADLLNNSIPAVDLMQGIAARIDLILSASAADKPQAIAKARALHQSLMAKSAEDLTILNSVSDPCSMMDCMAFPEETIKKILPLIAAEKASGETLKISQEQANIARVAMIASFGSFVMAAFALLK